LEGYPARIRQGDQTEDLNYLIALNPVAHVQKLGKSQATFFVDKIIDYVRSLVERLVRRGF